MARPATATRPRTAPLHPRRVSGPAVRRPVPVGPTVRGRTGAFERLARIPDHRIVDRLLRSRLCIWVIGIMLGGIVFMQVSLLRMNTGISRAVATQETLVQQNATLQAQVAKITSGDRVREAALKDNMIEPSAGKTPYLTARESDARKAVKRMRPPSARSQAVMANNGMLPGALSAPGTAGALVAAELNGAAQGQVGVAQEVAPTANATGLQQPQPEAVATATALPTPGATPQPAVSPAATVAPVG